MESKPFWASKTIWANIVLAGATIATAFGVDLGLDATAQSELVAGIAVAANLVLRFITNKPVA